MSDKPNEIYENIKEAWENRRSILTGKDADDYNFKPIDILKKSDEANKEAQAVINEALNTEGYNMSDFVSDYKIANGICGLARDNLTISVSRIEGIRGYI